MRSKTAFISAVPGRTEHDFQQAGIEMFRSGVSLLKRLSRKVDADYL